MVCIAVVTGQIVRWYQILWVYGVYSCCDRTDIRYSGCMNSRNFSGHLSICVTFVMAFQNSEMQFLDSSYPSLSLSFPPQWTAYLGTIEDFSETSHEINISLQSDKNSYCFTADIFQSKCYFPKGPALQFLKNSIPLDCTGLCYCVKDKVIPLQAWTGTEGSGGWG